MNLEPSAKELIDEKQHQIDILQNEISELIGKENKSVFRIGTDDYNNVIIYKNTDRISLGAYLLWDIIDRYLNVDNKYSFGVQLENKENVKRPREYYAR